MKRLPIVALLLALCVTSCKGPDASRKTAAGRSDLEEISPGAFYREEGIASWYGPEFHRQPTATGEAYDMYALTAAHKTLPLGTWVDVTALDTKRTVRVRINDRGPFVGDRIIDLSYGAAKELGILREGTTRVVVRCSFSEKTLREQLGYWVQLGAYQDSVRAVELALRLETEYPNVRVLSSKSFHHVRIGPFRSEAEATRLKEAFHRKGLNAFVVRDLLSLSGEGSTRPP